LWAYFHKDWLLQIREHIRPQIPKAYSIFVESEAVVVTPGAAEAAVSVGPVVAITRPERSPELEAIASEATAATVEVEESCELVTTYTLLIRRAPENRLVAVAELLSPTNKGVHGAWDRDAFLRKRHQYLESAVNLLEIDALVTGERLFPPSLSRLSQFTRSAWTAFHEGGRRRWHGWGWNDDNPPPTVIWRVEGTLSVSVNLKDTIRQAAEFNPWGALVG
jgi:hypothetical protein